MAQRQLVHMDIRFIPNDELLIYINVNIIVPLLFNLIQISLNPIHQIPKYLLFTLRSTYGKVTTNLTARNSNG